MSDLSEASWKRPNTGERVSGFGDRDDPDYPKAAEGILIIILMMMIIIIIIIIIIMIMIIMIMIIIIIIIIIMITITIMIRITITKMKLTISNYRMNSVKAFQKDAA